MATFRFRRALLAGAAALSLAPLFASAQSNYPNRAIRLVIPYAPGGTAGTLTS